VAVGEFQCRGPWVTGGYHKVLDSDRFEDGCWLRTGDVGTLDALGFMQIKDRAKDLISPAVSGSARSPSRPRWWRTRRSSRPR